MLESLHCTNCGAPLALRPSQTLVACAYCNSSLRVAPAADGLRAISQAAVTRMAQVPPEVVDEVKRLLVLGNTPKAVAYYAKETGLTAAEAAPAVTSLGATLGYAPPLNWLGLAQLVLFTLVGVAAVAFGLRQVGAGGGLLGTVLIVLGLGWASFHWLVLGRGLRGFWLTQHGTPAQAVILKRWTIQTVKARGEPKPVELARFLLEVRPGGQAPYATEANGLIRERSRPRFEVGCPVRLRFDPANPHKVVLLGPAG